MRTLKEITDELKAQFMANEALAAIYGIGPGEKFGDHFGKASIEGLLIYIAAYCTYTLEYMMGKVQAEVEDMVDRLSPGRPDWYAPLDFNHDPLYGRGESFAAYCILDTVAPGWAWINEVNVQANYETYDPDVEDGDRDTYCQYIEVAAPMEASLEGWSLELVNQTSSIGEFVTNTIAVFGENDLGTTKDTIYQGSNMLFYVVANMLSQKETVASDRYERTLTRTDGTYDGSWAIDEERCNRRGRRPWTVS